MNNRLLARAINRIRRCACLYLLIGGALLAAAARAPADSGRQPAGTGLSIPSYPASVPLRDFLNHGRWDPKFGWESYTNLGKVGYAPETVSVLSYELYDRLGNHMLRGYPLMSWHETRSDSLGMQRSDLFRRVYFDRFFNNLVVADDQYGGWSISAAVGDHIRTSLSPLTIRTPRWQGLRFDGGTVDQGFTVLMTRGAYNRFSAFDARLDRSPVLGYGGRYYRRISDVLTMGMTLFQQHQVDVGGKHGSFFRGTQPHQMIAPYRITVRIESDAPEIGAVAGVSDVRLEIVARDEDGPRRLSSDPRAVPPAEYAPQLAPQVSGGILVGAERRVSEPGEWVEYLFALPVGAAITQACFQADVSGNYRISVRQNHRYRTGDGQLLERTWPSKADPANSELGNPLYPYGFKPGEEEPHFTVARARGDPGPEQTRTVRFDYGIPSGKTLLGTDFQVISRELIAGGEVVYNIEEQHFPFKSDSLGVRGRKASTDAWAYLFHARAPVRLGGVDLELGGEVYRMDPDYSGSYDSRRGGTVYFTDQGGPRGQDAFTQEFPLMKDNDDDDEYPDDSFYNQGRFQPLSPATYSGGRAGGVFPGLDSTGDLTPDNDRNRNGVPDWIEPFLFYDSDPKDFVYGIDFNNNAKPDFRENDDHPDYPIRRDQKGLHGFVALVDPYPGITRLTAGWYSTREIAGWGEASAVYGRMHGVWYLPAGVRLEINDDIKMVEDTIRDDVYEWVTGDTSALANVYSPLVPPPPDPLVMRKSLVNFGAAELSWEHHSGIETGFTLLHYLNRQFAIEGVQESGTYADLAYVARLQYSRRWRYLDLWSGVKYRARSGHRGPAWPDASIRFRAAAVTLDYQIMPGMSLRWGMSGIPGLRMRYTDSANPSDSYTETQSVLMLQGTEERFMGYHMVIGTGVQLHRRHYDHRDPVRDFDVVGIFVEVIAGN